MPSLRDLGLVVTVLLSAAAPVVSHPFPFPWLPSRESHHRYARTAPTVPSTGTGQDLPPTNYTIQYVALGRGTQNYSCSAIGATAVLIGAKASLYDLTSQATANGTAVLQVPAQAVYKAAPPESTYDTHCPYLGQHYFDSAGTPTFDLTDASPSRILHAAKVIGVNAPPDAVRGPDDTPAVQWLYLNQNANYQSTLKEVYRVETAGGSAKNCSEGNFDPVTGVMVVQYAALYMFTD